MNTKSFIIGGLVGGLVDWLLGWLFYGILFADKFPQPEEGSNAMLFITFGCFAFGFFISYIYNRWAQIATFSTGLKAGAVIGLFFALTSNAFRMAQETVPDYQMAGIDIAIGIVMTAIVGGVIGAVSGKVK